MKNIYIFSALISLLPGYLFAEDSAISHWRKADGYYSQSGQDRYLHENFFKDKSDGIFVDIGAHNGVEISNTKFFEEKGWKGICIEPIPEVFEELKKNREAICIQGCISDQRRIAQFLRVKGYPEMLSGLFEKYNLAHLERIRNEVADYAGSVEFIDVDVYLLNDVLEENNIFHVDYLSIDTEGGELDILRSIDFKKFDIDIIDVENNYHDDEMIKFVVSQGYEFVIHIGCDDIFRKIKRRSLN